jgi:high affinity Mn2+ porin
MWRVAIVLVVLTSPASADERKWWLEGWFDLVGAVQPGFSSARQGSNSLRSDDHTAGVVVDHFGAGYHLTATTTVFASIEATLGEAFANGRGVGAPLDDLFVRVPTPGANFYLTTSYVEQIVPLWAEPAVRRLAIRAGVVSAPDWFDEEERAFASGALRSDAGWEYPADDHGVTGGALLDYQDRHVRVRLGELLMPHAPRATGYDLDLVNARGEVLQATAFYCIAGLRGEGYAGAFINHGDFGNYGDAIAAFEIGNDDTLDVTHHRVVGNERIGYFGGVSQTLPADVHFVAGFAWSDSNTESFGATETDRSLRILAQLPGAHWGRPKDLIGAGIAFGGLTKQHRDYLALGGDSSLLGDGGLVYGVEQVSEVFYSMRVMPRLRVAAHVEVIARPGFDVNRGPVTIGLLEARVAP